MASESVDIETNRLEAFSDAVIAVAITIMVLELRTPEGHEFSDLKHSIPTFLIYVLSFTFIAIYWNNHHHLLRAAKRISGAVMWSNMALLFWIALVPFVTSWAGEHLDKPAPSVVFGVVAIFCGLSYQVLEIMIVRVNKEQSFGDALGRDLKGKISVVVYFLGILVSFVHPYIAYGLYAAVTLMWFIPDRRLTNIM